ncbi:MAG: DUF6834 family protein [Candidatus Syntropharchaeales archaeon]
MKQDEIIDALKALLDYINIHRVLSEEELRLKITEEVSKIDEERRKEIEYNLGGNMEDLIFESITTQEKLSITSPDLHVKINYLGEVFYCPPSHTYMEAEIKEAFLRLAMGRVDFEQFKSVVSNFLASAGYEIEVRNNEDEILAAKDGFEPLRVHLLPTINLAANKLESLEGDGNVLVVPTEKTPWAFVNFIHNMDDYQISKDTMIWVVNIGKGTVDPLIGNPTDEDIALRFDNPMRARKAVKIWRASAPGDNSFLGLN